MKKITTFWLAILLACSTMIGCQHDTLQGGSNGNEAGRQESTDDKDDTDETLPPFEDVIKDYDQNDSQQGFSIKGKRYTILCFASERFSKKSNSIEVKELGGK